MLRLFTLGELRLEGDDGGPISRRGRPLVLLAYLARRAPHPVTRTELAELLWADRPGVRARQSLRQALVEIHRALGEQLEITPHNVRLAPDTVVLDIAEFERDVEAGRDRHAVARWSGEFLDGIDDRAESTLRDWIESERAGLRRRLSLAFERLADDAERRGANREAVAVTERWVELASLDEHACQRLIVALRRAGRFADALACHSSFVTRMKEQLESEPSRDFLRLARSLDESARTDRSRSDGAMTASPSAIPFVGRAAGFAALTAAWQSDDDGLARIAVVRADPGMGSTRLLSELASWCRELPARPLVLASAPEQRDTATTRRYRSARAVLAGLASAPALGGLGPACLRDLGFLLPALRERFSSIPPRSEEPSLAELTAALGDALEVVTEDVPALVLLGRTSEMDAESRSLLLAAASTRRRGAMSVLVVDEAETALAALCTELGTQPTAVLAPLRALTITDIYALLDATASLDGDDRDALATVLYRDTAGIPRYLAPAIEALLEERILVPGGAAAVGLSRLRARVLPIPDELRIAVSHRLAALGDDAHRALEAATVIGEPFTMHDIQCVADLAATTCVEAITTLESAGWSQCVEADSWIVKPPMLQRALHSLIPPLRRETLHAAVATMLLDGKRSWMLDVADRSRVNFHLEQSGREPARTHRWRWVGAGILVPVVIVGAFLWIRRVSAPAVQAEKTVAVFPFAVSGGAGVQFLRTGMVDLLSTSLDGAGGLRTIDPRVVIAATNAAPTAAPLTPREGLEIARRLGASHFVLGTVVSAGGRLNASAILYEVRRGDSSTALASAVGSEANLFDVIDRLSAQLAVTQSAASDQRIAQLAAVTTTSLEALKAYLAGRDAYRDNDLFLALSSYQRAVVADSTFALAWYGLATTASWMMRSDIERDAAAQAERQSTHLSLRDRALIRGFAAYSRGSADSAERLARYVTEAYDDIDGWVLLGEVQYHHNWKRGRPMAESREAWQRVLALDSTYWPALQHLAEVAAMDGHAREADSLLARYERSVGVQHMMIASRAMRAYALGDTGARASIESQLASDRGFWLTLSTWYVSVFGSDIEDGRRLALHLTQSTRPPEQQGFGRVVLAHLALARGKWREARAELAIARKLTPVDATEYELLLDLAPFLETAPADLAAMRSVMLVQSHRRADNSMAMSWPHTQGPLHGMARSYLMGMTSARAGDDVGRMRALRELAAVHDPTSPALVSVGFAQSIRAEHERMLHNPAAALAAIEAGQRETPFLAAWTSGFVSQAYERYERAELLHELGRDDEALHWYGTFAENSPYDLVYLAPALYKQARIYDARGDKRRASERYRRFLSLWKDCDPELAHFTTDARIRLAQLH